MKSVDSEVWLRSGLSLVWDARALGPNLRPEEAVSVRGLTRMAEAWPEELPSQGGDALLVGGLESLLDCLSPEDAEEYLRRRFVPLVENFQRHYEEQAALMIWIPSGLRRVRLDQEQRRIIWLCAAPHETATLALGRLLWSGAEKDVRRIQDPRGAGETKHDKAWLGLFQARVS